MIRIALFLIITVNTCLLSFGTDSTTVRLNELRTIFIEASYNKTLLPKVDTALLLYTKSDATKKAYQGAKKALTARLQWNPFDQISTLKQGLKLINEAVGDAPNNLEVRFIRFATLHHVPTFLGLSDTFEADKDYVYNNISKLKTLNIPYDFAVSVYNFMIESKRFTETEQTYLQGQIIASYAVK